MNKTFSNQKVRVVISALKPWFVAILFVMILRFTGALSGISFIAQSAIMKTGLMNFEPEENVTRDGFDYNFSIKDLNGKTVDFSQFRGKVVFLNLWATWCGPCRVEMPSIQNLYNSTDHDQIIFVMLSIDAPENQLKVVKYINDKEFNFPVYVPAGPLTRQLDVPSIPTTFIISKDGKIKSKKVGTANYDTDKFKKFLQDLVAE
jgi:thiol-disulfide isomerase/thioredoxin